MKSDFDPEAELQRLAPLRVRLAAVFGVDAQALLPVRGAGHAAALLARLGNRPGDARAPDIIDERLTDWSDSDARAPGAMTGGGAFVYREIGAAYGCEPPLCGVVIGTPAQIAQLTTVIDTDYFHPIVIAETMNAVAPHRLALKEARVRAFLAERARIAERLKAAAGVRRLVAIEGPYLVVETADPGAVLMRAAAFEAALTAFDDGGIRISIRTPAENDRVLAAFGLAPGRAARVAEVIRETKETKIACRVDLDRGGDVRIATGAGYFDHMLEQIAAHGGLSLHLTCAGDAHVDLHHTIEDCALALGAALSKALGERRGVARYGFTLPMDEAEARVSIDLGGRPYAVFEGAFAAPLIGQYPTEMTAHVFRSMAQTLGAAIHVAVRGENDHHKTEACFKAFARALRAAIAVEGDAVPSTKGTIG